MVKALVLDMDGVIRHLDFDAAEEASQSKGFNFEELMEILWDNEHANDLLCGRSNHDAWWEKVQNLDPRLKGVSQDFVWKELLVGIIDNDVIDFVREVRNDLATGILTNCSIESKEIILNTLGENHPFDFIMSSSDFGFKKPQPEVYQSMLARIDVRAEDCLFFDDRTTNVEGAKAIGIQAYLFESVEQLRRSIVPT